MELKEKIVSLGEYKAIINLHKTVKAKVKIEVLEK